ISGLAQDDVVIGMVARYHDQKDFPNFAQAAGLLARDFPKASFILCGAGVTRDNAELVSLQEQHGLTDRTHTLGLRLDIEPVNNAFDIATLSSSWGVGGRATLGIPAVPRRIARVEPASVSAGCCHRQVTSRIRPGEWGQLVQSAVRVNARRSASRPVALWLNPPLSGCFLPNPAQPILAHYGTLAAQCCRRA
ncbi:MAG: hypothetical protein ACREMA_17790, partial [Longimicrobiales bacterium]